VVLVPWVGFVVLILFFLALDLGVFNRKSHVIGAREALAWTFLWVSLALAFNVFIYHAYQNQWFGIGEQVGHATSGKKAALDYLTAYLVEKSLSLDNIFVIALIFGYFRVPDEHQHRLLFWGVLGALVMRGIMIALGAALIERFDWIVYVFGILLLATAVRLLLSGNEEIDPNKNYLVRLIRRIYPVETEYHGLHFFVNTARGRSVTPLFIALIVVETTDVAFAVDSIPAVFAITHDPFIVFTSNVFAILGLRSLYFALAAMITRFKYLKASLVFLLAYVGVKMLLSHHHPIPTPVSLAIIVGILTVGVVASLIAAKREGGVGESERVDWMALTLKEARKIVVLLVGSTIILAGAAMLILPGPGIAAIVAGLGVLATEFVWAARWLKKIKEESVGMVGGLLKPKKNKKTLNQ
jgi:tellurite resistance protein TerC